MTPFRAKFDGLLYSLLSWDQLAAFWPRINAGGGWYLYAVGQEVPAQPADAERVAHFIEQIDALLHAEHEERYCGIVYADDVQAPTFVVIYDPHHLGVSCGSSKTRVMPGWIMSQVPPEPLGEGSVVPNNRKRWWEGFLAAR